MNDQSKGFLTPLHKEQCVEFFEELFERSTPKRVGVWERWWTPETLRKKLFDEYTNDDSVVMVLTQKSITRTELRFLQCLEGYTAVDNKMFIDKYVEWNPKKLPVTKKNIRKVVDSILEGYGFCGYDGRVINEELGKIDWSELK